MTPRPAFTLTFLAALFFGGLALLLWPVYVATHRNERVRLESQPHATPWQAARGQGVGA